MKTVHKKNNSKGNCTQEKLVKLNIEKTLHCEKNKMPISCSEDKKNKEKKPC